MARRPPLLVLASSFALAVALSCDPPGGTVSRDATAKQILSFREDGTSIARYMSDGASLLLQTTTATTGAGNKVNDFSRVNLTTKMRDSLASGVLNLYEDASLSNPPALVSVAEAGDSSGAEVTSYVATIAFPDGKPSVQVDRLASSSCCDWLASPWAVRRFDGAMMHTQFWIGHYESLMAVDPSLQVGSWRRAATSNAFLASATTDPSPPQTFGIWSIGLDGSAPTPLLGPTLGPITAVDPNEDTTNIASPSLNDGTVDLQECWSPGDWSTGLDFGIEGTRCYAVYQRTVGRTKRLFLHDYDETTERLLPGPAPSNVAVTGWNGRWLTWWSESHAEEAPVYTLFIYDLATKATHQCQTGQPGGILWQTTGPGAVITSGPSDANEIRTWDLTAPTCPVAAMAEQPSFVLSPDGKQLAWLETNALIGSKITLAKSDLSNQRVIAEGTYFQQIGFLDDRRMLIWRTGLDGFGYSWIDTTLSPPVEHALAEQVFFISSRLDAHQILIGHRFNDQDKTGDLSLIDMDTAAERLISHGVADATLRFEDSKDGGKTHLLDVAFLVRGRYASDQDGLWLAKIPFEIP